MEPREGTSVNSAACSGSGFASAARGFRKTGEIRRYRRLASWDYGNGASLFISMSTDPRTQAFGRVVDGRMDYSPLGKKVMEALETMPSINSGLALFGHVVMPDHVHFNVHLAAGLDAPLKVLGNAIRRFKNHTTKLAKLSLAIGNAGRFGGNSSCAVQAELGKFRLWQQGYHDYLLRSRKMIDSTERYIAYNPQKWQLMHGSPDAMRIIEPLDSPRLDPCEYWKGVGNVALLDGSAKLLSLRVSREVREPSQLAHLTARMQSAVANGYIIISGFISKGEQTVRDMLCRRRDACFIRILPSGIPNARFRPESRYVAPFSEGRYLEIACGNDEREFGRDACLDLNAEIVQIATAAEGLAVYWKADGPHILAKTNGHQDSFEHSASRLAPAVQARSCDTKRI